MTTVTIIMVLVLMGLLICCILIIALYERHLQKKKDQKQLETQDKYRVEGVTGPDLEENNRQRFRANRLADESSKKPFAKFSPESLDQTGVNNSNKDDQSSINQLKMERVSEKSQN